MAPRQRRAPSQSMRAVWRKMPRVVRSFGSAPRGRVDLRRKTQATIDTAPTGRLICRWWLRSASSSRPRLRDRTDQEAPAPGSVVGQRAANLHERASQDAVARASRSDTVRVAARDPQDSTHQRSDDRRDACDREGESARSFGTQDVET